MPPKVKAERPTNGLKDQTDLKEVDLDQSLNTSLGIPLSNVSSTTSGSTDFVKKLFLMLEDNSYNSIVRWTSKGDSFVVLDTNEFTKEILPKHFKHSNFASFVRQLNKYDFHKVKQSNEEKQQNEFLEGAWEFKHPDFRRHDREALETIKRKGPVQRRPNNEEQSSETIARLEDTITKLSKDQIGLKDEIKLLNERYTNVIESVITMKSRNDSYFRSINTLVGCLLNQGIKIPQLDLPPLDSQILPPSQHPHLLIPQSNPPPRSHPGQQQPQPQQQSQVPPQQTSQPQQPPQQSQQSQILQLSGQQQPPGPYQHRTSNSQSSSHSISAPVNPNASGPVPGATPSDLRQQQQPTQPTPKPSGNLRPGFHVLLVEDDNVCIQLCSKFLSKYGCTFEVVSDGLTAISALEKSRYDIVFMDIIMPNLDGATATSVVRNFDNKTPIIAMTGNIEEQDLYTYIQHGMSDILAKPFTKDELYLMLEKHLHNRTPLIYQTSQQEAPQGAQLQVPIHGLNSETGDFITDEHVSKRQKL